MQKQQKRIKFIFIKIATTRKTLINEVFCIFMITFAQNNKKATFVLRKKERCTQGKELNKGNVAGAI